MTLDLRKDVFCRVKFVSETLDLRKCVSLQRNLSQVTVEGTVEVKTDIRSKKRCSSNKNLLVENILDLRKEMFL